MTRRLDPDKGSDAAILHDRIAEQAWGVLVACERFGDPRHKPNVVAHAIAKNVLTVLPDQGGRDIERRALGNAIDTLAAIAAIIKLAQHEPRKDAWRSINAIAGLLSEVCGGSPCDCDHEEGDK